MPKWPGSRLNFLLDGVTGPHVKESVPSLELRLLDKQSVREQEVVILLMVTRGNGACCLSHFHPGFLDLSPGCGENNTTHWPLIRTIYSFLENLATVLQGTSWCCD